MRKPSCEWHLASLVVMHHPDAAKALAVAVASAPGMDLAVQDATRSIIVQESDGTGSLMDGIDVLQSVSGVMAVNLVHHHVERFADPESAQRFRTEGQPQEFPA